jgi:autotransporter passenger strand-loop-strand repeat protein
MSVVSNTIVNFGQFFYVSAPVSAYYTTAFAGGYQYVYGGGFAVATVVSGERCRTEARRLCVVASIEARPFSV